MRSFVGRTLTLGICAVAGLVWSGCEGKPATEYVTGVSTQVKVPRDIKAVRLQVTTGGVTQFCQGYKVYDGVVLLPRSLGTYANSASAISETSPITYTVVGVADKDADGDFFATCSPVAIGQNKARVLRRSTQPYIPDEIRFIPMPLKYSCFDKQCGEDQTCKGGKCVPAGISRDKALEIFPKYDPGLVDGSSGGCFDSKSCLGGALPALVVDRDKCIYAVANSPGAPATIDPKVQPIPPLPPGTPWDGTNVKVVYDGGLNTEVLDLDPEEGFFIPDPAKPQVFQLAPGLCEMVNGADANPAAAKNVGDACDTGADCKSDACRDVSTDSSKQDLRCVSRPRVTSVLASGTCQSKRLPVPFCLEDQFDQMGLDDKGVSKDPTDNRCTTVELKPPKSALMIVVDDTQGHGDFFDESELKTVKIPLADPAFAQTEIGLVYAPVSGAAGACTANATPVVPLEPSLKAKDDIIGNMLALAQDKTKLASGEPQLEGALASAYTALTSNGTYYKRAVLVVGNRGGNEETCNAIASTPATQAAAQFDQADPTKTVSTYVIQLVNGPGQTNDVLDVGLAQLAGGSSAEGKTGSYDPNAKGSANKKNAQISFGKIINTLATCVYDVPAGVAPANGDIVSFSHPITGATTRVDYNEACTTEKAGDANAAGWGFGDSPDPGMRRIYLCSKSCTDYQGVLAEAQAFSLAYLTTPPAVPVFAHAKACDIQASQVKANP